MSPAKQKSSDKHAGREKKSSSRQASASGGTSASAYNPAFGTFHTLESVASDPGTPNQNGRFRSTDDPEDHSGLNGVSIEYDSVSNNSSCSGESEDQSHFNGKEKQEFARLGTPPGLDGGVDKRDKIRWKNEKKHQRQKERRAQELKDKCTGYLMSRKLEALVQQLVSMGFSSDNATMALILNEGHVEQSVSWLLEGGEGQIQEDWNTGGNLKIDIFEELAQMTDVEKKNMYTRPDIERAIVSCEGDLEKAIGLLHARNRSTSPATAEELNVPSPGKDVPRPSKEQPSLPVSSASRSLLLGQAKNSCLSPARHQPRKEDKDLNPVNGGLQASSFTNIEGGSKEAKSSRSPSRVLSNRQRPSSPIDKRETGHGRRPPSTSVPTSQSYATPAIIRADLRTDSVPPQHRGRLETKTVHIISRESSISAQVPQPPHTSVPASVSMGACSAPASPLLSSSGWGGSFTGPSTVLYSNSTFGSASVKGETTVKQIPENLGSAGVDSHGHYHPLFSTQLDAVATSWTSGSNGLISSGTSVSSSSLSMSASHSSSSSLTSFGLYTGWGSGLSGSAVDWSMGTMANCDYKNIDWSMAASPSSSSEYNGVWGLSSSLSSLKMLEGAKPALKVEKEEVFQSTSGDLGLADSNKAYNSWISSSLKGQSAIGLQDKSQGDTGSMSALPVHEWTSPFAGKDLFTLPHQAVSSPSL